MLIILSHILNCAWSDWWLSLNPIEIAIDGIFGALIALVISIVYARELDKIKSKKLRIKFEPISGDFIRYLPPNGETMNQILSKAKITYDSDNKLTIE